MRIFSKIEYPQEIDYLFWVGCSGSYDKRTQRITKAFCLILDHVKVSYAILGEEETCTGDPARRAGNEFLFQLMAKQNIQTLSKYNIKKIITTCPHCFNTLKNEYSELGGNYEVAHHTQFIQSMLDKGLIVCKDSSSFKGKKITYHDSCYLGRANAIYEAPRSVLEKLDVELVEMKRCKKKGLCCGAGGGQLFKEEEKGDKRINKERYEEAQATEASVIATACPFCTTMFEDSARQEEDAETPIIMDIAELVANSLPAKSQ